MKHLSNERAHDATSCTAGRLVGANLRDVRKGRGWSQTELGQRVGMGQATISSIERGARCPSLSTLFLLARACEVETARLVRAPGEGIAEAPP